MLLIYYLNCRKEDLQRIFEEFGAISSIYFPMDLKRMKPKGLAFIRYIDKKSAEEARVMMNNTNLGYGRNIMVTIPEVETYFNQDETPIYKVDKKNALNF